MRMRKIAALVAALMCLSALPAGAEGVPCLSGDALPGTLEGIFLTRAPEEGLTLGGRTLRSGDVLTGEQAAKMTFSGGEQTLEYLPIFAQGAGEPVVMTIGKKTAAPVAEDSALETYENIPITGTCKVTGDSFTVTLARPPKRGTVELREDGSFTYTPKKNKVGV